MLPAVRQRVAAGQDPGHRHSGSQAPGALPNTPAAFHVSPGSTCQHARVLSNTRSHHNHVKLLPALLCCRQQQNITKEFAFPAAQGHAAHAAMPRMQQHQAHQRQAGHRGGRHPALLRGIAQLGSAYCRWKVCCYPWSTALMCEGESDFCQGDEEVKYVVLIMLSCQFRRPTRCLGARAAAQTPSTSSQTAPSMWTSSSSSCRCVQGLGFSGCRIASLSLSTSSSGCRSALAQRRLILHDVLCLCCMSPTWCCSCVAEAQLCTRE